MKSQHVQNKQVNQGLYIVSMMMKINMVRTI